ncbi:MAG: peptidylprolyl isomerase [Prevotella sp.]
MIRKLSFAFLILSASTANAQTNDDDVVMTVNGSPVTRSEFVYSYNKNNGEGVIDRKTVEEYAELYVNYRLKVAAAMEARLDTMTSFLNEYAQYRDRQVLPAIVTNDDVLLEAKRLYDNRKMMIGEQGLIQPAHIMLRLPQKATDGENDKTKARIDSIYAALQQGADFADMARRLSQDPGSASNGGLLPWICIGQTLKEFEDVAFSLQTGQMSKPFISPAGYHIVLLKGRKQLEPFEELRDDIVKFIEKRNLREAIASRKIEAKVNESVGKMTKKEVMDQFADSIGAVDSDMKWLFKEYHDGLLLYEISNRMVWEKAAKDEEGLARFFKANKKNYAWKEPRFKGIAFFVRNSDDVKEVKKCVKKLDFSEWNEQLKTTFNSDSIKRIRVEKGIFRRGDNAVVDRYVFKADTTVTIPEGFVEAAVYGKKLKAPKEYTDVRGLVVSDYQELLEKEWVAELRRRFPVDVNREVLKTIIK